MKTKKHNKGGARKGSGRKPSKYKKVLITARVKPITKKVIYKVKDASVGAVIDEMVNDLYEIKGVR